MRVSGAEVWQTSGQAGFSTHETCPLVPSPETGFPGRWTQLVIDLITCLLLPLLLVPLSYYSLCSAACWLAGCWLQGLGRQGYISAYKALLCSIPLGVVHFQPSGVKDICGVQSVMQGNMFHILLPDLFYEQRRWNYLWGKSLCEGVSRAEAVQEEEERNKGLLSCSLGNLPRIMVLAINAYNSNKIPSETWLSVLPWGYWVPGKGSWGWPASVCGKQAQVWRVVGCVATRRISALTGPQPTTVSEGKGTGIQGENNKSSSSWPKVREQKCKQDSKP